MKRILTYIILLASVSVSCNRYEADGYKFGNSIYMDVSSRKPVQSATFGNKLTEFLQRAVSEHGISGGE